MANLPHLLGQQAVGRFEIRDFLGRGAIGDVLLAWDPREERLVALKVVRVSKSDPEMLEAEKNGLALQAQLARVAPQVAAVYEEGQDGDFFWVAMEYVAGADLAEVLTRGPLPEARAVEIALELVTMLEECHSFSAEVSGRRIYGIVHGDIKPENVRLQHVEGDGDRVRVLDFGIAKHLSQTRRFTVNLFGSLPYTPPERLERGVVDRHSDLWAVGVVLAAMVSGRRPFPGNTAEELEQAIRHGVPPLPLPSGCSAGLAHVVARSLAFDAARRYPTAAEMRADLAALRDGRPLPSLAAPEGAEPEGAASEGDAPDLHATRRTARPPLATAATAAEATRRTGPLPVVPLEETRRTGEGGGAPLAAPIPPGSASAAPGPPPLPAAPEGLFAVPVAAPAPPARPRRRLRRLAPWLAATFLVAVGAVQLWAWDQSKQLRREMAAVHPDLPSIAQRYAQAARWSFLSSDLYGVGNELLGSLTTSAGRILESYHGDDPSTTPRGWQTAYDDLHAAAEIAPRDRKVRARMVYAQGHLDRIASVALRGQGDRKRALAQSKEAVAEFQEAARLDPRWPDPYLGLARIYAYDLFDLDALQTALGDLGRLGYPLGRREKAMLADGFRMQGLGLEARAQRARGTATDSEASLLKQARAYLQQAVRYYDEIPGYADSADNRAEVQAHLQAIEARIAPPPAPPHQPNFLERLGRALAREFGKPDGR
jgi:tetratricopeptide (TPR) repeat protein